MAEQKFTHIYLSLLAFGKCLGWVFKCALEGF